MGRIVTVKLSSFTIDKEVGPNISIRMIVGNEPVIGRFTKNKWLLQRGQNSPSLSIHADVTELDPVHTDIGSGNKTLTVDLSNPPNRGNDSMDIEVVAVGGDKGKTANFNFQFEWYVSTDVMAVVDFIQGEMASNLKSQAFIAIQKSVQYSEELNKSVLTSAYAFTATDGTSTDLAAAIASAGGVEDINALRLFINQVGYDRPWDHKAAIQRNFGDWSLDASRGIDYYFDIWSNIHYGWIGRAAGFSEGRLLDAAGIAQALHDGKTGDVIKAIAKSAGRELDDPKDQVAIRIGIRLWEKFGARTSSKDILDAIRSARGLHTQPAPEGAPPESFK